MNRGWLRGAMLVTSLSTLMVHGAWAVKDGSVSDLERRMFELVNQDRAERGLPALRLSSELSSLARSHSRDMVENGFFSHRSPSTGQPQDRLDRAGIGWTACAENIAMHVSVEEAQQGLMQSPGHRANLLSKKYTHIGIGVVKVGGQVHVTQNFLRPGGGGSNRGSRRSRGGVASLLGGLFR